MALTPGTRLGVYEIIAQIGEGGMGAVYRATDTNLSRQVAIKVLPDAFAQDTERLARFEREAKTLASLNHPNIAAIYGFEKSGGIHALVMELVEGDDLSQRLARGAIPLDEALPVAKQIAEALEAAHDQGIIHRDLKPANIKVRPDGAVKVLDFGLAKAMEPVGAMSSSATQSPTITTPAMMTGVGMILGTAAYMSPEQARGKTADKRSDIWAFGAVLYEMLTGRRPFDGEDVSDTLANVLKIDPDWSALPADTSPPIRTLLQSCLTKDRRRRVADISTAMFVLDKAASLAPPDAKLSAPLLARGPLWRRIVPLTAGALVAATVTGAGVWVGMRPAAQVPLRVSRLPLAPSGTAALSLSGIDRDLAIFPDGSHVVYVGNRGTQLFVRALDTLEPVAVFTGTPRAPFVSADGEWIGFLDNSNVLKKVAASGGPAVTIGTLDNLFAGATWGTDDVIIFATANAGLQRIGAAGGPTTVLARPDQGEAAYSWPELLPGGRAVLFTIITAPGGLDTSQVVVLDLQTGVRKILVRGGSDAHYVPTGHLVYAATGTLRAVAFDLARLETRGTPVPVIPAVMTTPFGAAAAAVAGDGTLAYVSGVGGTGAQRTLVWVDRQGRETPIPAPPHPYVYPQLSPDGTRVAVNAQDQENDIWIWNFSRTTLTRATSDPSFDGYPLWTPDGGRLVFGSARAGKVNLYLQAVDGTGSATRLTESVNQQFPTAITTDGTRVVFNELTPNRQRDLRLLTLTPTPRVEPLLETRFDERGGIVSPDGRWLAYESDSAGRFEIYVRPFPNVGDSQSQVSNAGGVQPVWARNGRELFYVASDGALMMVPVDPRAATWSAGTATKLVAGRYFTGGSLYTNRQYDVSPDGQRFLMIKEGGGTDQTAAPPQLIVVQHFDEELKRLVPTK